MIEKTKERECHQSWTRGGGKWPSNDVKDGTHLSHGGPKVPLTLGELIPSILDGLVNSCLTTPQLP